MKNQLSILQHLGTKRIAALLLAGGVAYTNIAPVAAYAQGGQAQIVEQIQQQIVADNTTSSESAESTDDTTSSESAESTDNTTSSESAESTDNTASSESVESTDNTTNSESAESTDDTTSSESAESTDDTASSEIVEETPVPQEQSSELNALEARDGIGDEVFSENGFKYKVYHYKYEPEKDYAVLVGYEGNTSAGVTIEIPATLGGKPIKDAEQNIFRKVTDFNVTFAEGTTHIAKNILSGAEGLKKVILPTTVTTIGNSAFDGCKRLAQIEWGGTVYPPTHLIIPEGVTTVGNYAFNGCEKITYVKLPSTLSKNNGYTGSFEGIPNFTAEFAQGTKTLYNHLRDAKGLEKVILPTTVTAIVDYAFDGCSNVSQFQWGASAAEEGKLVIPEGVTTVGEGAFTDCEKITYVKLPSTLSKNNGYTGSFRGIPNFTAEFAQGTKTLYNHLRDAKGLEKVILPTTVTAIVDYAFDGCSNVSQFQWGASAAEEGKLIIPEGVTTVGEGAFTDCEKITYVKLPSTLSENNGYAGSFEGIPNFTAEFAQGTKTLYNHLRDAKGLEKVILPTTVTAIVDYAFDGCSNVSQFQWGASAAEEGKLVIPEGVTTVGEGAFTDCEKITYVKLPSTLSENNGYAGSFEGIPNFTAEFAQGTKTLYNHLRDAKGLKKVILPTTVTAIVDYAFYGCAALEQVQVKDQPIEVGQARFPIGLYAIGANAFNGCAALREVYVSGLVNRIPNGTFQNCANLNKVTVNGNTVIENDAFDKKENLTFYSTDSSFAKEYAVKHMMKFEVQEVAVDKITFNPGIETFALDASAEGEWSQKIYDSMVLEGNAAFTIPITFTSDNPSVANVDADGNIVLKHQNGTANITATCGTKTGSYEANVVLIGDAHLNASGLLMEPGYTFQMNLIGNPQTAIIQENIRWSGKRVNRFGMVFSGQDLGLTTEKAVYSTFSRTFDVVVVKDKKVVDSVEKLQSGNRYKGSDVWTYQLKGAEGIKVTFNKNTNLSKDDFLYVYDVNGMQVGRFSGNELANKTLTIPGNTVSLYLHDANEGTENGWGFKVDSVTEVPKEITSDKYPIDKDKNISDIQAGATLESIRQNLIGNDIKAFDSKGKPVNEKAPLGTGYVLTMGNDANDPSKLTVVVSGDIDGDAQISVADALQMKLSAMGKKELEGAYKKAATFKSHSDVPQMKDLLAVTNMILGK